MHTKSNNTDPIVSHTIAKNAIYGLKLGLEQFKYC